MKVTAVYILKRFNPFLPDIDKKFLPEYKKIEVILQKAYDWKVLLDMAREAAPPGYQFFDMLGSNIEDNETDKDRNKSEDPGSYYKDQLEAMPVNEKLSFRIMATTAQTKQLDLNVYSIKALQKWINSYLRYLETKKV